MRVVICGSRTITDKDVVNEIITASEFNITEVIEGGAIGVDTIAGEWARARGIPVTVIKPQWNIHGLKAGPLRNEEMVNLSDAVIAIWNGRSRGTAHTIEYAEKIGKPVELWRI